MHSSEWLLVCPEALLVSHSHLLLFRWVTLPSMWPVIMEISSW